MLVAHQCHDRLNCGEVFLAHNDRDVQWCPYCCERAAQIQPTLAAVSNGVPVEEVNE